MFGNFTQEARKILIGAKKEMSELRHPYVGSEHMLLSILKNDNKISKKLKECNLDYSTFRKEIVKIIGMGNTESNWFLYTPLLKRILENAIIDSKENNNGEVTIMHLFSGLLEEGEGVAIRIMLGMNIDIDNLYGEFTYKILNTKKKKSKKLLLEELGTDLTLKAAKNELDPVIGRDKEIKRVLEILCRRTKNNPLLIGEAGVGKTAIVEEIARMIKTGNIPLLLKNKRIICLDMACLVAGTKYRGEFEEKIRKIIKEIEDNDDIILFIDEMHTLVGAGGAEGAIDASNILKPALARGSLRLIGATTTTEYKKYIEKDSALERRFQKITVGIPDMETVKDILMKLKSIYEKFHFVKINECIIDLIIHLSERYVYDRNQPDKAIDILDEVCSYVSLKESKELKKYKSLSLELKGVTANKKASILKNEFDNAILYKNQENKIMNDLNNLEINMHKKSKIKVVTKEDVAFVISSKTNIPIYELLSLNSKIIKEIHKNINNKIIGQDEAVTTILDIVKRIKLGFKDDNKCYSLMFTGPSGTGKTELAKIFAKNLVGNNIIRLDMSEFTEAHSVSKIIGSPPGYIGYGDTSTVFEEVRNKPYSVIILDEIEKAHSNIINLLFQIMDEGKAKDTKGNVIRFDHTIIVMTSNIGFHDINVGFNKINGLVTNKLKENFSIPFINRIDDIIIFNGLNENNIKKIVLKKIEKLKIKYSKKDILIKIYTSAINEIITASNYKEFGARKIDKIIKNNLENKIIDEILKGKTNITIRNAKKFVSN